MLFTYNFVPTHMGWWYKINVDATIYILLCAQPDYQLLTKTINFQCVPTNCYCLESFGVTVLLTLYSKNIPKFAIETKLYHINASKLLKLCPNQSLAFLSHSIFQGISGEIIWCIYFEFKQNQLGVCCKLWYLLMWLSKILEMLLIHT